MISKRRVSRWIAYLGVLALGGAIVNGNVLSALVSALLVGQYVAVEVHGGYRTA